MKTVYCNVVKFQCTTDEKGGKETFTKTILNADVHMVDLAL